MAVVDTLSNKMMFKTSLIEWLYLNHNLVQQYLDDNVHISDHPLLWKQFVEDPMLGKALVESYTTSNEEKINWFLEKIAEGSKIVPITGVRGSGKTSFAFWVAEEVHRRYPHKPIAMIESAIVGLPKWVQIVHSIFDSPEGSLVIFDEASITFAAREAMSRMSRDLSALLAISRHQGLTTLFISQHEALIDINILRLADLFVFKRLSWDELYGRGERTSDMLLKYVRLMQPREEKHALVTDGETFYLLEFPLPSFWSETISKSFKKLTKGEAVELAKKLYDSGVSLKIIAKQLRIRGINWTEEDVQYFIGKRKRSRRDKRS
jgi:hypothetical protein